MMKLIKPMQIFVIFMLSWAVLGASCEKKPTPDSATEKTQPEGDEFDENYQQNY